MFKYLLLLLVGISCSMNLSKEQFKIYSAKNEKQVSFVKMIKDLKKYDVIFVGEFHENKVSHSLELAITKELFQENKVALSFEMFERDNQKELSQYVNNEIDENEFNEKVRFWPNYDSDYKPLIEFARKNHLPVIAANVPRRLAAKVSQGGLQAVIKFSDIERKWSVSKIELCSDEYRRKFTQTMTANMGSAMGNMHKMQPKMLKNFFAAQCLKDHRMALSINNFLDKNIDKQVIHFNGNFHSENFLGTVELLKKINPELKIAVISANFENSEKDWTSGNYVYEVKTN